MTASFEGPVARQKTLPAFSSKISEVTVELQSTAQIANSVKDSFNGLYRMQG